MTKLHTDNLCADTLRSYTFPADTDVLQEMYDHQRDLQVKLCLKRHQSDDFKTHFKIGENATVLYWWGCATTELYEMFERLETMTADSSAADKLELQFEYIDVFHFMMNMFLYAGVEKLSPLSFEEAYKDDDEPENSIMANVGLMTVYAGQLIDQLPFKTWKSYPEGTQQYFPEGFGESQTKLLEAFFDLGKALDIDTQLFYDLYRSKKEENINRQNKNGRYAVKSR